MKTGISDLTEHLFKMLEDLDGTDKDGNPLKPQEIDARVKRANAIVSVSSAIVEARALQLKAAIVSVELGDKVKPALEGIVDARPTENRTAIGGGNPLNRPLAGPQDQRASGLPRIVTPLKGHN